MTAPNDTLRAVRRSMLLTQEDLARKLSEITDDVNVRTIQRWEGGQTTAPRAAHARALEMVTGLPLERLGFPSAAERILSDDGHGGHNLAVRAAPVAADAPRAAAGNYSGIWLSRYEYFSSGRDQAFEGKHAVLLVQVGGTISVHSLRRSNPSILNMTLTLDGSIATGTWSEQTQQDGYYRGARYHGAIQMIADPTGRRFSGKWTGFGKDGDINVGPWALTFLESSTSRGAVDRHDRPLS
jgi:transcriptional regulator with XRE-family HTH domain